MGIAALFKKLPQQASEAIDEVLLSDFTSKSETVKILLLGAGNTGKSTILKQLRLMHHKDKLDKVLLESGKAVVSENILTAIQLLVEAAAALSTEKVPKESERAVDSQGQIIKNLCTVQEAEVLDRLAKVTLPQRTKDIRVLLSATKKNLWDTVSFQDQECKIHDLIWEVWTATTIQEIKSIERILYKIEIPLNYFFDENNYTRICTADYLPSVEDVLYSRRRTTEIDIVDFMIDGFKCRIFDVGGQRNERKKWISHFSNVQAIMFLVALDEYNKFLLEKPTINRLNESVAVFQDILQGPFFDEINILLFLNKKDLLERKLQSAEVTGNKAEKIATYFPEYTGGNSYEAAVEFIKALFVTSFREVKAAKGISTAKSDIFVYETMATSTKNVETVFGLCKHLILMQSLSHVGMF